MELQESQLGFWHIDSIERSIVTIPARSIPTEEAYRRFQGAIVRAASSAIPCGRRPVYIPCLDEECRTLLDEYEALGDADIVGHLIESLDTARRKRWEETAANLVRLHTFKSQVLQPDPKKVWRKAMAPKFQ